MKLKKVAKVDSDKSVIMDKTVAICLYGMLGSLIITGIFNREYIWYVLTLVVYVLCAGAMIIIPIIKYSESVTNMIQTGKEVHEDDINADRKVILTLGFVSAIFETICIITLIRFVTSHVVGLIR